MIHSHFLVPKVLFRRLPQFKRLVGTALRRPCTSTVWRPVTMVLPPVLLFCWVGTRCGGPCKGRLAAAGFGIGRARSNFQGHGLEGVSRNGGNVVVKGGGLENRNAQGVGRGAAVAGSMKRRWCRDWKGLERHIAWLFRGRSNVCHGSNTNTVGNVLRLGLFVIQLVVKQLQVLIDMLRGGFERSCVMLYGCSLSVLFRKFGITEVSEALSMTLWGGAAPMQDGSVVACLCRFRQLGSLVILDCCCRWICTTTKHHSKGALQPIVGCLLVRRGTYRFLQAFHYFSCRCLDFFASDAQGRFRIIAVAIVAVGHGLFWVAASPRQT